MPLRRDWRTSLEHLVLALAIVHLARWQGKWRPAVRDLIEDIEEGRFARTFEKLKDAFDPGTARRVRNAIVRHLRSIASTPPDADRDVAKVRRALADVPVARHRIRSVAVLAAAWPEVPDDIKKNMLDFLAGETRRLPRRWRRIASRAVRRERRALGVPRRRSFGGTLLKTAMAIVAGIALADAMRKKGIGTVPYRRGRTDEATTASSVATGGYGGRRGEISGYRR